MYLAFYIIHPVLLLSSAAFSAAASADCFKQQGDRFTKSTGLTERISPGIVCSNSTTSFCDLQTGGFVNAEGSVNISTDARSEIFDAVGKAADMEVRETVYGSAPNVTYRVEPGQAGFYGFTIKLICYDGVLGDCIANVPNGTAVEVCTPGKLRAPSSLGVPILEGDSAFVNMNPESVVNMTTNPAAEARDSPAVRMGPAGGLMAIAVAMGIGSWLAL
jgi:hypothetical protein